MPLTALANWSDQTKPLILIAAQSGRFLAQIASRAGYPVRVADQFADTDTLAVAEKHLLLPDFSQLSQRQFLKIIIELADHQPANLIIGTGLEQFSDCLSELPPNISAANNSPQTLNLCLSPQHWFKLLSSLDINYPDSQFSAPGDIEHYLQKRARHWGGGHIQPAAQPTLTNDVYYQRKIEGRSASVTFIADGRQAWLISLNQQFCRAVAQADYRLLAVTNALTLHKTQQQKLSDICQKISKNLALRGFQSLDFIVDDTDKIWILELNPRPSASLQCLPDDWPLLDWHLQACQGKLPAIENFPVAAARLWYCCYAEAALTIPAQFNWPDYAADLPADGTLIDKNQVICSLLLPYQNSTSLTAGQQTATQLQLQLQSALEKPLNSAI